MLNIPMIVKKNGSNEYTYDLYSLLLSNRIIFITGEIDINLSNIVIGQLLYLDKESNEDIFVYINSPGGEITSGMAIYDTFNYIKSTVITIGIGICASMGAFLLACGNKRYALENTEIMIHEPSSEVGGIASNIKLQSDRILKKRKLITSILAKKTKKNYKQILHDTKNDYYMSAKEALKYGIIDEIIKKES